MANSKEGENMALVAKVQEYRVYSTNDRINPYIVKVKFFSMKDCGWHEKTVVKYADMKSCLLYIADNIHE